MSKAPRIRKQGTHWHADAQAAYESGAGLASFAVRAGVDLRCVLVHLEYWLGKSSRHEEANDLRERYAGYFHTRGGVKPKSPARLNAAHRREYSRPRRRGMSAEIIGPDGEIYG